jgi:uncharacterized protein (TIGR02453 family)
MDKIDLASVLVYLDKLSTNNNKAWFEENKAAYEAAKAEFEKFTEALIDEFRISDNLYGLTAKDCISRIYRDLRFSKDKSPYKSNLWATIAPGGKKGIHMGYHISIQPHGRSILAGGLHEPQPEQLARFRRSIDEDATEFKQIIAETAFVEYFGGIEGDKLKTAPQGYDQSHPEIELLRFKQVVVVRYFSDEQVIAEDFLDLVIRGCRVMRPFLDYFQAIS